MKIFLSIFCLMIHLMAVEPRRPHHHNGYPGIGEIQSFGAQPFQQSSAQANANAFSNQFGSNGFGSNAANAGAQSFNSGGPLGNFGAAASNSQSQGFNFNNGAFMSNANAAGSQTYNFGDKKISIAYSNGWNVGPDGVPKVSNSNSISFTK